MDYAGELVVVTPKLDKEEMVANLHKFGVPEGNILVVPYNDAIMDPNQYFDERIIHLTRDEVFVDGGCYDFSTAKTFLEKAPSTKRIYAFEPDENQWLTIENAMSPVHLQMSG